MNWYEDDVKQLEQNRLKLNYEPETLFYGSSTLRLWENLYQDFATLKPVNLGFGGSTLAACVWFFDRIMKPYQPQRLVVYAGDNDLGDDRHPEEVFIFFKQLVVQIRERFGIHLPCYFISLKPSISRWNLADQFVYTNQLIQDEIARNQNHWQFIDIFKPMLNGASQPDKALYADDGLHLSAQGYEIWKSVIGKAIL
ncbi:GDSL family lipase [Mucilaginibacter robiniae]|uniref:GDSL family lipase n=1 Tax=Mucilaginibacter robiniae TaxID=2728022 RepID=A0A7L5E3A6_9SPHI|nr:GDSL-type esterase/lipase family protein [Mucilaginibacter robiniae]QJD96839.1 GDSL family lipase [Mucilaginibacter robiniae]